MSGNSKICFFKTFSVEHSLKIITSLVKDNNVTFLLTVFSFSSNMTEDIPYAETKGGIYLTESEQ